MKQTVSGNIKCFDISCSDEDIEKSMNRKPILDTMLEEKDNEIERLNNIINELEDYICVIEYDERFYNETWQIAVRIHNKLKELKETDNNE